MKCGVYETVITPALGLNIPGYFERRPAEDIIDDLYAKAIVFDNGRTTAGIVVLDILHVRADMVKRIRERFEALTGVSGKGLMVAGTHVHTGQAVEQNDEFGQPDETWIEITCQKAADAAVLAYRRLQDCVIGFGRTEEHDLAFNRRFWQKDGAVHTWPGVGNPDNVREAAPVDPEVCVLRVDTPDGRPIAVLTGFANHLDIVGGCKYCSDYPGELSRIVKSRLGENVVSVFVNGFSGDVTHIDYTGRHPYGANYYLEVGRKLADDVFSVYYEIRTGSTDVLGSASEVREIPRRQPTKEMYEEGKKYIADFNAGALRMQEAKGDGEYEKPTTGNADLMSLSYAKCNVNLYENPILSENVETQVIRVGDVVFNGCGGELFAELGLDLKARSPFDKNINVELADGCYGYIATKHAFAEGGYEVTLDRYVNMSEDTGDIMIDTVLRLQKELRD